MYDLQALIKSWYLKNNRSCFNEPEMSRVQDARRYLRIIKNLKYGYSIYIDPNLNMFWTDDR